MDFHDLTEDQKSRLLHSAMDFLCAITDGYGAVVGHQKWETLLETFDEGFKYALFVEAVNGNQNNRVLSISIENMNSKIEAIRAIRLYTGMSLKEGVDIINLADRGSPAEIKISETANRSNVIKKLQEVGVRAV